MGKFWAVFISCFWCGLAAQNDAVPLSSSVYNWLDRSADKGIIVYFDVIRPRLDNEIYDKLEEIEKKKTHLNILEKKTLNHYLIEFARSGKNCEQDSNSTFFLQDALKRKRFFSYYSRDFFITLDPIYGTDIGKLDEKNYYHRWNGLAMRGQMKRWGFYFSFRDNREQGYSVNRNHYFENTTLGIIDSSEVLQKNYIEYSEVLGGISYSWNSGRLLLAKDFIEWGYGLNGNIVHSTKAPSYPFIMLELQPTSWMKFNYFHGWLNSDIEDSSQVYDTGLPLEKRTIYRAKYIASHTLSLLLNSKVTVNLGESIVYSDRIKVPYLIPVMFFRLADHYLSNRDNNAGDNAQIFMNLTARNVLPGTKFFLTWFVDEFSISTIFNKKERKNQSAFSVGFVSRDFGIPNLDFGANYTRINPFVYQHFIPTIDYKSSQADLGHWMGDNADQIYLYLQYFLKRGMNFKIFYEYIRKGAHGSFVQQYSTPQPEFLFGERRYFSNYGLNFSYEIIHNFYFRCSVSNIDRLLLQDGEEIMRKNANQLIIGMNYGF